MRVAIADRDPASAAFLLALVEAMGHSACVFVSGVTAITQLQRDTYDLLILSERRPDGLAHDVLGWVRSNMSTPPAILMMTDEAAKADIAMALHAGADDYVVRNEDRDLLEARIAALLRRAAGRPPASGGVERYGGYVFDRKAQAAALDGREVPLTAKEFALALLFFGNTERPLSRGYLLDAVWNSVAELPSRTLDMHVSRIRSKLKLTGENGYRLFTVFGYGYRLEQVGVGDEHAIQSLPPLRE